MKEKIFFESIKINNGKIHNGKFHRNRMNNTRKEIFGIEENIKLENFIKIPDNKFYKCRIEYNTKIISVKFIEYQIEKKKKFTIVKISETIKYDFKTTKRDFINEALKQKKSGDDIIMLRGGFLTDSSVANIACYINGEWITPDNPISKGTTRERLLQSKKIIEGKIKLSDIKKIEKFALMNALCGFLEIEDFHISYI